MNRVPKWMLLSIIVLILFAGVSEAQQQCTVLNSKDAPEQLVAFLRAQMQVPGQTQNRDCMAAAMFYLAFKPAPGAIEVLAELLDFARPLSSVEKHGFFFHPFTPDSQYPATGALSSYGKTAIPALINKIRTSDSHTVQGNAAFALVGVYSVQPEDALKLLMAEMQTASSAEASRLRFAIKSAVPWCGRRKAECDQIANGLP